MNPKPKLILVAGLPASGKTTLADALATRLGAVRLNSDALRQNLNLRGHYDAASKQMVYNAMLSSADNALRAGKDLVVDSTFYKESLRQPWQNLASQTNADLILIEVTVADEDARRRLKIPRADSEATWNVYTALKEEWEPIMEPHLRLNASKMSLEQMVDEVLKVLA